MASEDDNENVNTGEPVGGDGPETTVTGKKRAATGDDLPQKPKKKFAKRTKVWQHFIQRVDDDQNCNCRYCGTQIACDTKRIGTSSMKGQISRCKLYKDFEAREKQQVLSSDNGGNMRVVKYDPELYRRSVNELVVVNELPFSFVESEGWRRFCFNMLPLYTPFSRRTSCRDIVSMYLQEKEKLKHLFSVEEQRISLTTDIWVSQTTGVNYMVVTGHWINVNWEMHKRILSFKVVTDHKGDTISRQLVECLEDWGIKKVFTVIVDNAKGNDKALEVFTDELKLRGGDALVIDGEYLHMRCCSHILNLIVGDGLKKAKPSIVAIRNAIKFVRSSSKRLNLFALRCEGGKVCRGSLPLDIVTRWNSTYLMLTAVLKLRVPFERMLKEDKLYDEYFNEEDEKTKAKSVGPPTNDNWEEVTRLVKFLKIFYKATLTFSASTSVTSTLCYKEIVNIERCLIAKCCNSDKEVKSQSYIMRDKFEKYWDGLMNMNH